MKSKKTDQNRHPHWDEALDATGIPASLHDFVKNILAPINAASVTNIRRESESCEYGAAKFVFLGKTYLFRQAKTTPKKAGQFVTLWKREQPGAPIAPLHINDGIDIVVIAAQDLDNRGYFVFETSLLGQKGVFSEGPKMGKRAMRVYAPWVVPTSAQARRTQAWQSQCFVALPVSEGGLPESLADVF